MDRDREGWKSLEAADAMISDWSGVAFEYALGLLRPVIFLDTQRKVNNPEYGRLRSEPFEVRMRDAVGAVVPCGAWNRLRSTLADLLAQDVEIRRSQLRAARAESVFNVGGSARAAAQYLTRLVP